MLEWPLKDGAVRFGLQLEISRTSVGVRQVLGHRRMRAVLKPA